MESINLLELAKIAPDITVSVRLADLVEANMEIYKVARQEIEELLRLEQAEEYLSIEETAAYLKVDPTTLWRWDRDGYLLKRRVGSRPLYAKSDILKLLKKRPSSD